MKERMDSGTGETCFLFALANRQKLRQRRLPGR